MAKVLVLSLQVLLAVVGVALIYYYLLLACGGQRKRQFGDPRLRPVQAIRFGVVIPAHNEAAVIGKTVSRLREQSYPVDLYDLHVVADHCTDETAKLSRSAGAIAHERQCEPRGKKGYALAWIFPQLLEDSREYDALVVFDADSQVDPSFLATVAEALSEGAQVVQGQHIIANPEASVFSRLADADMRINNRIRNQAKENLGLSARLMGDGMCFSRAVLTQHPFVSDSMTEDREYGIVLVERGLRVCYASRAATTGQAVVRWGNATKQRLRWYAGALDLQRRHLAPLLARVWRERSLAALDTAVELCVPSYSTLCLLAIVAASLLMVSAIRQTPTLVWLAGLTVLATIAYPFLGLWSEDAVPAAYAALVFGPVYAVWRVVVGWVSRLRRGSVKWVRTQRVEEEG